MFEKRNEKKRKQNEKNVFVVGKDCWHIHHIEKTLKSKYHTPTHIQYNYTQRDIHSWNQSE